MRHILHKYSRYSKKYAIFIGFSLLFATCVYSQKKAVFQWGSYQNVPKYSQAVFSFNYSGGYGLVIRSNVLYKPNYSVFFVKFYNKNLKFTDMKLFIIHKYKERLLDIWMDKQTIFFLTEAILPNQKISARLRTINSDSIDAPLKTQDLIVIRKNHFTKELGFHISKKDTSLSLWYTNPADSRDSRQSVTSENYTFGMKFKDKAVIDLPEKADLCEVYRVDNIDSGQFLIYTREYDVRPIKQRGFKPNYRFVFYVSNPSNETLKSFIFKDEDRYLERGKVKWKAGVMEATGLFASKFEGPKMGIWYLKYDFNNQKISVDTIQYFDKSVKSLPDNGFQPSMLRNSKLESFFIDYFIKLDSEKRVVVYEQFFLLPASIGSSYTYNRFYGDIMLLFLNKNGEIYNARRLVKAQQTYNNFGEFSSYYLERKDSVFRFFYNDHFKNNTRNKFRQLVWHKHSCMMLTEATEYSLNKVLLANYKQTGGIVQTKDMLEIAPNQYLIYSYKKKKAKLGIMKLE